MRENRDGKLFSLVCGNPCAIHLDPIEKKPLFHVLPSSTALSVATAGCNLHCKFCQNWEFSQASPEEVYSYDAPPELIVRKAGEMGARSIAHTYVEPTVFYEYMLEVGSVARQAGLMNVMHSNGFINPAPLQSLCRIMDAANIDLKAFSESFYQELCSGALSPVLETLKTLKKEEDPCGDHQPGDSYKERRPLRDQRDVPVDKEKPGSGYAASFFQVLPTCIDSRRSLPRRFPSLKRPGKWRCPAGWNTFISAMCLDMRHGTPIARGARNRSFRGQVT